LTTLLALVGVLFIMAARLDKMGATATSDSRELDFAVDTVVAQISDTLARDVPGVSDGQECYDYPDANDPWLADLEPYRLSATEHRWRQVSNLTGVATSDTRDVAITPVGERAPIADVNSLQSDADADGDGVSDARWHRIPGVMSSRGKPFYAAVRIIDNGAMLNINTGCLFSDLPLSQRHMVDGSRLNQINVAVLARGVTSADAGAETLLQARGITDTINGLADYEEKVVWGYLRPNTSNPPYIYTPFDLSDELELRYRFILNRMDVDTSAEAWGRFRDANKVISTPVDSNVPVWFGRVANAIDPNAKYAYRHVATTYNMDRIIAPKAIRVAGRPWAPWKMINVNRRPPDVDAIREAIALALGENNPDTVAVRAAAAQITANLLDYIDEDDLVTAVPNNAGSEPAYYYGFERPCIYISEVACHFVANPDTGEIYKSYAVELYKPYFEDNDPGSDWQLVISSPAGARVVEPIAWSGTRRFHVMLLEDPAAKLFDSNDFSDPAAAVDTTPYDRTRYTNPRAQGLRHGFEEGSTISLERWAVQSQTWVADVDSVTVPAGFVVVDPNGGARSIQRDISPHKCVRRLWSPIAGAKIGLGGAAEPYVAQEEPDEIIQAHPANRPLTNIGELGMVFARSAYDDSVVKNAVAAGVLFDLMNPDYARVFNYLTVMDPTNHGWDPNETRIMGRININTAPYFVLSQLPWMQYADDVPYETARAIIDDRNVNGPYRSVANLMRVEAMRALASDEKQNWFEDTPKGPDLDLMPDGALDDFEERDLLFRRISDLVTVRSDVFTAYILVRIGPDGPQKRMIAILDRSAVTPDGGRVRIVALHPVADPR
jgi:hypothetical protein